MKRWLSLLFFLAVTALAAAAQTDTIRLGYSVHGRVVDAKSGKALEAVHVSVPGRNHATVTNEDGDFILRSDRPINRIECSCIGYQILRQNAGDAFLNVRLLRENTLLEEAAIIYGDPRSIVASALIEIQNTYCTEPELLECFYRETLRKGSRYTYVAEAVARLYKDRYNKTVYRDAAALEKSRTLISQRRRDTLSVKTQGGPALAINMDAVKNGDILLNWEDLNLYRFELDRTTFIDDRPQFVIRISPMDEADYPLFFGTLYIDRELLTFTRIELSMDMSNQEKVIKQLLVSKPARLRFFPEEASYVMNYSLRDGHTTLSYFRATMRFSCNWRRSLSRTRYTAVNELVVTDILEPAEPIARKDRFSFKDILCDTAPAFYDDDFWSDYNIIAPSETLEHAVTKLKKRR